MELELLFANGEVAAFHKPSGLLVHRSPIDRRETAYALQMARERLGRRVFPVHRLDKPTSGILLFALTPEVARHLGEAFAAGRVEKSYLAVVRGVAPESGTIDHPLGGVADRRDAAAPSLRPAVTHFRRLASAELPVAVGRYATSRYSLVEVRPRTGRRHQLRRHLKHIFHPIVGDTRYGEGRHNRFFREAFACRRMLLAAVEIRFHLPSGGEVTVTAPPERAFSAVLSALGWEKNLPPRWRR